MVVKENCGDTAHAFKLSALFWRRKRAEKRLGHRIDGNQSAGAMERLFGNELGMAAAEDVEDPVNRKR